ncbi:MAG: acetate--CoA ligase, partial [Armatimonadetes bacterium]|nr:acetate--CoA ligase [Armatimonadota bacterium]
DYEEAYRSFSWADAEKEFDWHRTGKVNIVHEAVDRHAVTWRKNKVALYYTDDGRDEKYTFQDLRILTSRFGNVLKKLGIRKGDRVATLLPRTPELYVSVLGINRIGAIPVPLFEAFMEQAIRDRLEDSETVAIVTTPALRLRIPTKDLPALKVLILVGAEKHSGLTDLDEAAVTLGDSGAQYTASERLEVSYEEEMAKAEDQLEPEWLTGDDGLIIHYTSGSTGKSKGALHRQYAMVGHYQTAKWALDLREDDVYWCTADPGWVTGTSYGIYGPWTLGISSVVLGGRFEATRWYRTIEKYRVTMWYSAPTAYRLLMAAGNLIPKQFNLSSLRHICTVGEPLNPEALRWVMKITGLPPHETWWMTETGMQLICNYRCAPFKIGATGKPFPGTYASVADEEGNELPPYQMGHLVVKPGWPSMMHSIWKNEERYKEYFRIPGWYVTGDSAYKDEDGFIWYAGRADDVIKTAGERVGPFEVESALVQHEAVAEAGVIGKPDPIRGQIIKAFVTLRNGYQPSDSLKQEIIQYVKENLAVHAAPRELEFRDRIPKTRSGKIMRRVLKAWDLGQDAGDISTMEE